MKASLLPTRRPRSHAAPAALAVAGALSLLAGPTADAQVSPPRIPAEPQDLQAVEVRVSTVRPEHMDVSPERLARLEVPAGFRVETFADGLEEPRVILVAPGGDVYVSERSAGRVRLLRDADGDGRAEISRAVATGLGEGLQGVHGLALRDGHLYMVTETELYRATVQVDGGLGDPELLQEIPAGGQHPNRTLGVSPDGTLFLSIGSTCNACSEPMDDHAALHRLSDDGRGRTILAEGLRNTIAFGWHPSTGQLWGLDHNSDDRGDEWPPEELNAIREGGHYGWPFCGGEREPDLHVAGDPQEPRPMTKQEFCAGTEAPALTYTAHAAPMQVAFYTGDGFPSEYRGDAFATMRGSWNRNPPSGYELVRIRFDASGNPTAIEPFIRGWLQDGGTVTIGRLMGLAQAADGSLLVGDDHNGVIYRVSHGGH